MAAVTTGSYVDKSSLALWDNQDEMWIEGKWSFSVDGGATTDTYDLMKLPVGYMIIDGYAHVTTACAGATGTYEIGVSGATAGIFAQTAVASMTEDKAIGLVAKQIVTSNNTVYLTIGTAAATAGVVEAYVKVKKAN
jgi:hypothetical protein